MAIQIKKNVILAPFTTFGIGGPAEYFCGAKNAGDIIEAIKWAKNHRRPYYILGGGSNLLIADEGMKGLVIKVKSPFDNVQGRRQSKVKSQKDKAKVFAEAGVNLSNLLLFCIEHSLSGLEFLTGIPGTLGGAIVGNAGTKDGYIAEFIDKVTVLGQDSKIYDIEAKQCGFGYRSSRFRKSGEIVLSAVLKLKKSQKEEIKKKIKKILEKRKDQPKGKSAGCIFKNPVGKSAGYFISKVGLKGKSIGGIKVSEKHANFFINTGGGRAREVIQLIKLVQRKVKEKFNIVLEPEIFFLGEFRLPITTCCHCECKRSNL